MYVCTTETQFFKGYLDLGLLLAICVSYVVNRKFYYSVLYINDAHFTHSVLYIYDAHFTYSVLYIYDAHFYL